MADISTGRQRGIVPFVDETTGRLPDQYLPQGVIDLQGDLEQAVTDASASATEAKASETAAKSSADSATQSASAAAQSAESAQTATESAASSKDAAAQSASEASASAQAAETSKTSAAFSASAAETSGTNAAASASAAKTSETNAAASATAAQQAVDGFGLQVGTTTTGDPGTDAAVEIQKNGNKYTANFTIPRGDVGPSGVNENVPLGSTSGVVAQASDAYPALPRKVQVHGRTIENLFPVFDGVTRGVTFSTDANGYISIKGTATNSIFKEYSIDNLPQNTKVWIYVDSDFKAKRIANVYAQSSGWSVYAKPNEVVSSTTPSATSGSVVISIGSGVTVDAKIRVMFVASETEPDANLFVPSGVHTVEPEKLVVAGKNIYDESYATLNPYWGRGEFDENGDLLIYSNSGSINSYSAFTIVASDYQFHEGEYVVSAMIPNIPNSRLEVYNRTDGNYPLRADNAYPNVTSGTVTINPEKTYTVNIVFNNGTGTAEAVKVSDIQIERGTVRTSYSKPETTFTNLPSDISLADGDTLTIDRDGTTRILHSEGEPTVLDNVTLPELPVPTFNVYTTGGYIQPTVDVDYEQDVNLVLEALEAKIAALQVADKTN